MPDDSTSIELPLLHQWHPRLVETDGVQRIVLCGTIYNHACFADGGKCTTSAIAKVNGRHVWTVSSSQYYLGELGASAKPALLALSRLSELDEASPLRGVPLSMRATPVPSATSSACGSACGSAAASSSSSGANESRAQVGTHEESLSAALFAEDNSAGLHDPECKAAYWQTHMQLSDDVLLAMELPVRSVVRERVGTEARVPRQPHPAFNALVSHSRCVQGPSHDTSASHALAAPTAAVGAAPFSHPESALGDSCSSLPPVFEPPQGAALARGGGAAPPASMASSLQPSAALPRASDGLGGGFGGGMPPSSHGGRNWMAFVISNPKQAARELAGLARTRSHWRGQHEFGIRLDMSKPDNVSFLSSKLHATLEYAVGFERRPSALEWARKIEGFGRKVVGKLAPSSAPAIAWRCAPSRSRRAAVP